MAERMMDKTMGAKLAAEFVGTMTLLYVGVLILTAPQAVGKNPADLVSVALAHGLAIGVMASALMLVSGAHFNPAVTAAAFIGRKIKGADAIGYICAQLAGAAAGALLAKWSLPTGASIANGVPTLGAGISPGTAILVEAILTFFLVFVVYGTGIDARFGGRIGGLAIGLTVTMGVFAGGVLTGAALNPARWFGAALVDGNWNNALVWIAGPLAGGVIAGAIWSGLLLPKEQR
jgi:MIP family channel proteins